MLRFEFRRAFTFLPQILIIGLAIGTANFFVHAQFNWLQWVILSSVTSLIVGLVLMTAVVNKPWLKAKFSSDWKLYWLLGTVFCLAGLIATEVEAWIKSLVFGAGPLGLLSAGNMYLFNAVIALALGVSFFRNGFDLTRWDEIPPKGVAIEGEESTEEQAIISAIPVKRGEATHFIPIREVVYFEAYDNYAFVLDRNGEKRLCDYFLLFLEKRLGHPFVRIHRKYVVNLEFVTEVKPYLNGRYLIEFGDTSLGAITSSKGYAPKVRELIKLS